MVAPSPNLDVKIKNTEYLIKTGRGHLIPQYSKDYPEYYLDIDRYNKLVDRKPWKEHKKEKERKSKNILYFGSSGLLHLTNLGQTVISNSDKVLILCVDFNDKPASIPISTINNLIFGLVGETFKNFYSQNSYGLYIPDGMIYGWYRMPNNYASYVGGDFGVGNYPTNAQKMVEDALDIINRDNSINWNAILNSIDVDNDGIIERLIILHSGGEAAWDGDVNEIWAHMYNITSEKTVRGKKFYNYATVSEYMNSPSDQQRCGILVHEYGHLIGLPDLYDTTGVSAGLGYWSVMASGSWGNNGINPNSMDAWCKKELGWTVPIINQYGNLLIRNAENYQDSYQFVDLNGDLREYFLIENRQQISGLFGSFDTYLPGSGILIYHVNENNLIIGNDNRNCYLVGLIQADNKNDLENNTNRGDVGDPYGSSSGNHSFGLTTNPGSKLCNGSYLNILLDNIYSDAIDSKSMDLISRVSCISPICDFVIN